MRFLASLTLIVILAATGYWISRQASETPQTDHDVNVVVVYTSHDDIYSKPILDAFSKATGIVVKPKFDTESNKTVGLVNLLLAERQRPRCDVFWNNEIVHTIHLARNGIFQPYESPNAVGIPKKFRTPLWTGFAARARILIVNTTNLKREDWPTSGADFLDPKWSGRCGIAKPLFGTTSTHMAVLFSQDPEAARNYVLGLRSNGIVVEDGNGAVMRSVAEGRLDAGWTDTDDAFLAKNRDNKPVEIVVPGQDGTGPAGGVILIPNTVSLIAGAPHTSNAKKLIDFLLRPETEVLLANMHSAQIPLHSGVDVPDHILKIDNLKVAAIDWTRAADAREESNRFVQDQFLK